MFKISINDLDDEKECILTKFADNTKLRGEDDISDDCAAIQRHMNWKHELNIQRDTENWIERDFVKLNKGKCKVLLLGRITPCTDTLWVDCLESRFAESILSFMVDSRLIMSQQCAVIAEKANSILHYVRKTFASSLG